ncbi:MAG: hypothetical protein IT416_02235, partial [Candidatus Pacebacteria bacterium]|nr:hypothetical protein [Candidatus Paceibacterota bacterium]
HLLNVYPKLYGHEWQVGYQQMVEAVTKLQRDNPDLPVYITRERGRPAMYYWFYTKTDPEEVQFANQVVKKDQAEFLEFKNIKFINTLNEVTKTPAITANFANETWLVKVTE